jgi:hypothetical protein
MDGVEDERVGREPLAVEPVIPELPMEPLLSGPAAEDRAQQDQGRRTGRGEVAEPIWDVPRESDLERSGLLIVDEVDQDASSVVTSFASFAPSHDPSPGFFRFLRHFARP